MNENKEFEHEIDPDLLAEIEEWEKAEHDEPAEYYFSNPDPYLKPQPLPPNHPRHNCYFNEDGHLCVKNLSAFWLPEFTLQKEIGGTVYTVTGSYDGVETLDRKMERIMGEKFAEAHRADLAIWDAANRYLRANLPDMKLTPKAWQTELAALTAENEAEYAKLKALREEVAELQKVRRYVDVALKADAPQKAKNKHHDIDR